MKFNLAAGTLLSVVFWSLLSVSLFAAPLMTRHAVDPGAEVQDLIRQHVDAISPMPAAPEQETAASTCETPPGEAVEQGAVVNEAGPDAPIIRPVGRRAERIQT